MDPERIIPLHGGYSQSKEGKATVPIDYEARLAEIDLKPEERPKIDANFE